MAHPLSTEYKEMERDIRALFRDLSDQVGAAINSYADADGNIPYNSRDALKAQLSALTRLAFVIESQGTDEEIRNEIDRLTLLLANAHSDLQLTAESGERRRIVSRARQLNERINKARHGILIRSIDAETGEGMTPFARILMTTITKVISDNVDNVRALINAAFASRPDVLQWLAAWIHSPRSETKL